jgi:hypothetical protein
MFDITGRMLAALATLLVTLLLSPYTRAQTADDRDSLSGLKEVKAVFDVHEGDGKALLNRLDTIEETRQSLAENVAPGIKVVGNSWISLMAYQAKGYSYISP